MEKGDKGREGEKGEKIGLQVDVGELEGTVKGQKVVERRTE
jgi:hypothetical protein